MNKELNKVIDEAICFLKTNTDLKPKQIIGFSKGIVKAVYSKIKGVI